MRKFLTLTLALSLICSSMVTVDASRKRNTDTDKEETVTEGTVASMTMEEYANQDFVDTVPGKPKEKTIYDGYHYNGIPIDVPDFSRFTEYTAEKINTFSDAVVDYLGWDILLGTSDWMDNENYFYFNPIDGLSSPTNQVFGYGRKKFGEGELKFKAKINNKSGEFSSGWMGISFRCTTTQALQWGGNPGYMIIVKPDTVEMQKWFNSCIMLDTPQARIIKPGEWQEYSVVTKKLEQGTQIIFSVDGVEYLNVMDTEAPSAPDDGYFMITNSGLDEIQIAPIDEEITVERNDVSVKPEQGTTDTTVTNSAEISIKGDKLTVNSETKDIAPLYFENGTAMVPVRATCQNLGGLVGWNSQKRAATISKSGSTLIITDTYDEYILNGKFYKAKEKVLIKNGNLYAPADILAEVLNAKLSVNSEEVILTVK